MQRLTKTYSDGSFGVADDLPCDENSHEFKKLLIDRLGMFEERIIECDSCGRLFYSDCKVCKNYSNWIMKDGE